MREKTKRSLRLLKKYWVFIALSLAVLTAVIFLDQFIRCNLVTVTDVKQCTLLGQSTWEWLKLLVGPVIATIGGIFLNQYFKTRDNKRREQEKRIEEDRLRQNALVSYFDQMTQLFLSENWPKSSSKTKTTLTSSPIIALAKARTFSLLNNLDSKRKGSLILFLFEARALNIISLRRSNLHKADLRKAKLFKVDLHRANLSNADLNGADLYKANLYSANLNRANLQQANLYRTRLYKANLNGANLIEAKSLTVKQVKAAHNWDKASYSEDFRKELGLGHPKDKPELP